MAKKSRMGRNLNALLGGATRQRATEEETQTAAATEKTSADQTNSPAAQAVTADPQPDLSAAHPAAGSVSSPLTTAATGSITETGGPSQFQKTQSSEGSLVTDSPVANPAQATDPFSTGNASDKVADNNEASGIGIETLPADAHPSDRLRMLGVDQITRGMYQPRRHFDQDLLQELADSIKAQGLIQPILVRAYGGKFELIAGERRWRASQLAGITDIPAIVRDMDDQSVAAVSLIENIQRADLNPLEEAQALERLCGEFSMTHQQVAEAVGRSRVAVTNLMRLLELHDDVKKMVDDGELDMGHARALLGAPRNDQPGIAKRITQQGLTVRAVEKLVKGIREGKSATAAGTVKTDPNIEALGQKLGKTLGAPVSIKHQQNGSGKLEITYSSIDELEGILSHIK